MTITINGTTGLAGVDGSASTPAVQGSDTNTGVFFPAADTVAISTGGSERMRVDSSGNVGVGTSSPGYKLTVSGRISYNGAIGEGADTTLSSAGTGVRIAESSTWQLLSLYTAGSERARIDSSGNLLVGTTSAVVVSGEKLSVAGVVGVAGTGSTTAYRIYVDNSAGSGASSPMIRFSTSNGVAGTIISTSTSTTYATSSDYRLKHDIAPMTGALAKLAALRPVTYKWNADDRAGEGFIAHELQAVVPDCVTGEKDAVDAEGNPVHQGIDTSFLVATLTAAIQEQQALITSLTARIAALEGAAS